MFRFLIKFFYIKALRRYNPILLITFLLANRKDARFFKALCSILRRKDISTSLNIKFFSKIKRYQFYRR